MVAHAATYIQRAFRGRNDDGSETAATWIAAENTNWTQGGNGLFRVRFGVRQDTSNADTNLSKAFKLKFSHNGGGFVDVGAQGATGIAVRYGDSTHLTDNQVTTEQLAIGDTFVAGRVIEVAPTGTITFPSGQRSLTEIEAVLEIVAAQVATDDTIVLRVYESNDLALSTYEQVPTITIGVPAPSIVTFAGTSQTETQGSGGLTVESPPSDVLLAGTSSTVTDGSGSLTVEGVEPHYLVFRRTPQTGEPFDPEADTPIATTTLTSFTDENVADGDYDYQVFATDGEGAFSSGSDVVQVTVVTAPEVLLAGTSTTHTEGSGTLARTVSFAGTSRTETAGSGSLTTGAERLLAGTSSTETQGAGRLTRDATLAGASATEADGSGGLSAARSLSGSSATTTDGSGALTRTASLSGTSATHTEGSGSLTVETPAVVTLSGTSRTETAGSGALSRSASLAGTSATETRGSGDLTVTAPSVVTLSGTSATGTQGSGALAVTRPFAGTSATETTGSGDLFLPAALSYPFAIFTDTLRPGRWDDADPRPGRWFHTVERPRWDDADPRPHRWKDARARPHRWTRALRPVRFRQAVRPARFYATRFVRIEEASAVPIEIVDMGEFTRGENPEPLLIRWFETRRNDDEEPVGLFGADEQWSATAIIKPPSGDPIERDATILDPEDLLTADPDNFPDSEDTVGWLEVRWHRGDLVTNGAYELQVLLEETAETKPLPQRLLLCSQTVWRPQVVDQPATDKALEIVGS